MFDQYHYSYDDNCHNAFTMQCELSFEEWIKDTAELLHPLDEVSIAAQRTKIIEDFNSTTTLNCKENDTASSEIGAISRLNSFGREFVCGRPLELEMRKKICDLSRQGWKACQIASGLNITHGCVSKIIKRYKTTGLVEAKKIGGSHPRKSLPNVVEAIVKIKSEHPTMRTWELSDYLITEGVCNSENLPTLSSINRIIRKHLGRFFARARHQNKSTADITSINEHSDNSNETILYGNGSAESDSFGRVQGFLH